MYGPSNQSIDQSIPLEEHDRTLMLIKATRNLRTENFLQHDFSAVPILKVVIGQKKPKVNKPFPDISSFCDVRLPP